VYILTP